MALIPGSYARAAGLQSEINNVTITRVAGSEVQFQRTIDTYQKELRYHVNQIGREQKQLRRSMRRYSRKLHHSRKQQKQREAKVKEDAERLKQHAESFKRAEEAVKRSKFQSSAAPQAENPAEGSSQSEGENSASADNSDPSAPPEDAVCDPSAEPDDGVGGESGEKTASVLDAAARVQGTESEEASESRGHKKVFLTKGKLPYLGVQQTDKEDSQGSETSHQHEKEADVDSSTMGRSSDTELCLPVIEEEAEGNNDRSRSKLTQTKPSKLGADHRPALENRPVASSSNPTVAPMHTVTMTSLNTKAFSANEESGGGPVVGSGQSELWGNPLSLPVVSGSQDGAGRRTRGKTGVSFGDLIKLQHMPSSSTKRLFKMVDRLASKHGIKDLPPASSSSSPSSLDPRSNEKIKLKRHTADSQLPDGIVRQAAVLYSMKYGYHDDDEAYFDDTLPPIILSQDISHDFPSSHPEATAADSIMTKLSVLPHTTNNGSDVFKHYEDSLSDMTLRKFSSLSIRHESVEATSPVSALSEAKMSMSDDHTSVEGVYSADTHASRSGVRRSGQVPTMSELSHHVTRIRDRTAHAVEPQHATDTLKPNSTQRSEETAAWDRHSPSTQRMSTLSRHSRPKSRSRRDTVSGQLQKRLTSKQHGDGGQTNAWQSAFGRLKVLHTLQDLSEHFRRSGD